MVNAKIKSVLEETCGKSKLDETILDYIGGVLEEDEHISLEDFTGMASPFLMDSGIASDDSSAEELCKAIIEKLRVSKNGADKAAPTAMKKLSAPVNLSQQFVEKKFMGDEQPDWAKIAEKPTLVDSDKLEAYEARKEKLKAQKLNQPVKQKEVILPSSIPTVFHSNSKTAANMNRDIHLENFDIAYGKDMLFSNGQLHLAYGRKYGLVGRNGTGKSTLLRHMSGREIMGIPGHIRILHVEQEVHGDDTSCLQCVLDCDVEREKLLKEEKELNVSETSSSENSDRLRRIYERLQEIDAYEAESKAAGILAGLGFTPEMQASPTKSFSGGWRMRIALARALFCAPDLLILDEPTNHLDLYSTLWLESYLQSWKGTIFIVSHQREFLNGVCTDIILLHHKKLEEYKGNYDTFESTRYEQLRQQSKQFEAQNKQRKHIQAFVDRFRYNANRAALVQSRLKSLEKMQMVEELTNDPNVIIRFPDPSPLTPPILQFNDATFGYDPKNLLFRNLNMGIDMDSRVALVGANGAGKSTLMNLLAGELEPTGGQVMRNPKVRFARFSQHFVDQLNLENSPVEHFMNTYPGVTIQVARSHLGSFGLSGDIVLRTINTLSGGQKSRLVFAVLAWRQPHILLLDEPSNHLDIETIDSLAQSLLEYKGGVLLISHDERLISMVCDELWYFHDGKVERFNGDFNDYKKMLLSQLGNQNPLLKKQ